MQKTKTIFSSMSQDKQAEAMTIICNIQQMQTVIFGSADTFETMQDCTISQLRVMQSIAVAAYNKHLRGNLLN